MSNKELLRLIGDQWKTLSEDKKDVRACQAYVHDRYSSVSSVLS
jgi:hypothetical protein